MSSKYWVMLSSLVLSACAGTEAPGQDTSSASSGSVSSSAVVASSSASASSVSVSSVSSSSSPVAQCVAIPVVDRVVVIPASGAAALMVGGIIQGSSTSPTGGFVTLATITTTPSATGLTLTIPSPQTYRYMRYYGPLGTGGNIAELQFYSGTQKLPGILFGTPAANGANSASAAFDGSLSTYFVGAVTTGNQYVGLDLANGNIVTSPTFSPESLNSTTPISVSMASATSGANIYFTVDGTIPTGPGGANPGALYSQPITVSATATVSAIATANCAVSSPVHQAVYTIQSASNHITSSLHLGNSLTIMVMNYFPQLVNSPSQWSFNYCASAGQGTSYFVSQAPQTNTSVAICDALNIPTAVNVPAAPGGSVPPVIDFLRQNAYDNLIVEPFGSAPCRLNDTVASPGDISNAYALYKAAAVANPNVQFWDYATWPQSTATNWAQVDCIATNYYSAFVGSTWNPPTPTDWVTATRNHVAYHEALRDGLDARINSNSSVVPVTHPMIVPVGLGLINLKAAFNAGISGFSTSDNDINGFFYIVFNNGSDIHLTAQGSYFDSLMFYACVAKKNPIGLPAQAGLTAAQALAFQQVAWNTAYNYKWCGLN